MTLDHVVAAGGCLPESARLAAEPKRPQATLRRPRPVRLTSDQPQASHRVRKQWHRRLRRADHVPLTIHSHP